MNRNTPFISIVALSSLAVVACGGAIDDSSTYGEESMPLGERMDLSAGTDDSELDCTSGNGKITCTSDYYWVCPDGWSACSQEGAKTCCEKRTTSIEFGSVATDFLGTGEDPESPSSLTARGDDAELECKSGGGKITCTSDYYWVCPDGWSACSQAGAATCCEKKTSSEPPPDDFGYVTR